MTKSKVFQPSRKNRGSRGQNATSRIASPSTKTVWIARSSTRKTTAYRVGRPLADAAPRVHLGADSNPSREGSMARINTARVVMGGLAAGVVMNVLDFVFNVLLLGPRFERQTEMLNPALTGYAGRAMAGFITLDFLLGLTLVWLYAAIRPRFGPGPRTAIIAGLTQWVILVGAFTSYWFQGMYTWRLVAAAHACGLVVTLVGACVGGMLYKEAEA
jgi:hypothetical protein